MSSPREFEVILQPEEEGGFSVFVPELPSEVMAEEGLPIPIVERGRVAVGG